MSGETKRRRGPRPASTYRGARRNAVLRGDPPGTWGPQHHYARHDAKYRRATVLSKHPSKYHPSFAVGSFLRSIGKKWIGTKAQQKSRALVASVLGRRAARGG